MKKWISIILCVIILSATSVLCASSAPKLIINGEMVITDVSPVVRNGRTLVPIRIVSEKLGSTVDYNSKTKGITIKRNNTTIKLTVDNKTATVNGVKKSLDEPARAVNGRTLVPVRFVSESFGISVQYKSGVNEVHIGQPSYKNEGTYLVGKDISAGEYVLVPQDSFCYFSVNKDANGNHIINNGVFDYPRYVTVNSGVYLEVDGARIYPIDKAPQIVQPTGKYVGHLKVGKDIAPGTYLVKAESGVMGYYAVTNEYDDIYTNDIFYNQAYVTVKAGQYLELSDCYIPR